MSKYHRGFIIAFLFVIGATSVGQAADHEVLLGTVYKGTVLAVPKIEVKRPVWFAPITVLQGPLLVEPGKAYKFNRYKLTQGVLCNQPYRWRVVDDMFWGSCSTGARRNSNEVTRIPLEDFTFYDRTNAIRDEQYQAKYPDVFSREYREAHSWSVRPVNLVCYEHPLAPGDDPNDRINHPHLPTPGVFFDVYPSTDNKFLQLFILDQDKFRIWQGSASHGKGVYWKMDWGDDEKEIESFKSPFQEAFTVFVRDHDYYFVTESGHIYLSRDPGKGERKIEKVWGDQGERRLPVCALITDAATDKVYCFVEPFFTDKQDEERVYFELSAKPEPKPYKLQKIENVKIEEPLKSVLEFAHVLQKDKRIK